MSASQTSRSRGPNSPYVTGFYEPDIGSIQYVVSDPATKKAIIVDAVLNFDLRNARTSTASADELLAHVRERGLAVEWIIDTHPHADHFMAAAYLKDKLKGRQAIGEKCTTSPRCGAATTICPTRSTSTPSSTGCSAMARRSSSARSMCA